MTKKSPPEAEHEQPAHCLFSLRELPAFDAPTSFCRASPKSNLRNLFLKKSIRTFARYPYSSCYFTATRGPFHHSPFSVVFFFLCFPSGPRSFCLTPLIAPFRPSFLLHCNARMGKTSFLFYYTFVSFAYTRFT